MSKALPDIIENILMLNGAVTERQEDGGMAIILPQRVARMLNIPEYTTLCFSYNHGHDSAIYASYDSGFFLSVKKLLDLTGRVAFAGFEAKLPGVEKVSAMVAQKIGFDNATLRIDTTEMTEIVYILFFVKYTALSDEKHEGWLPIMVNNINSSVIALHDTEILEGLTEYQGPATISIDTMKRLYDVANRAAPKLVEAEMAGFSKSLERRLNRDIRRVYEYYETLKTQTKDMIAKKTGNNTVDASTNTPIAGEVSEEYVSKLRGKLTAIASEQEWKIRDLVAKYSLRITGETVGAIAIHTQAIQCRITIKRRLASRQFSVTYNPLYRQLDPLSCESCFRETASLVCDDHLHIVCMHCLKPCQQCGKTYCRKCQTSCPKCKKT